MTTFTTRLADVFDHRADSLALACGESTWKYAALAIAARRRAADWLRQGARPGDRVLVLPGDRAECLIAVLAAAVGRFDVVSPSQRATAAEIDAIRETTRPTLTWPDQDARVADEADAVSVPGGFGNVRIVFFTSGSTTRPKGVCHDFESLLANADAFNRRAGVADDVRMLHVMPIGYMAGLLNTFLSPLMAGGAAIVGDAFSARTALQFWTLARHHSVNAVWLSPTMAATVTQLCRGEEIPAWARRHLRHVFVGTAPLHPTTRRAFHERLGVDCLESYGMTECMFAAVNPPDIPNPRDTVGLLLDGVEAQARDADGRPLTPGDEGPLWIRSRFTMQGYLDGDWDHLVLPLDPDGWLDTGDIGIVDADGRLTITGRLKDLIIRGGINVSPKAVEDVILAFPGVGDAAVVGVAHPFWGEEVVACVIASGAASADVAALAAHCTKHLPADAVPTRFIPLTEFPRAGNGKIQKHLLRRLATTPAGDDNPSRRRP
jgi:long-chain acyl-CoA synthetase